MKGMIWKSAIAAFSMYSKIPMPQSEWEEETNRYLLCWFPAVGLVIGVASCALMQVLSRLGAGPLLTGTLLTALPILLTGGIHMDGFPEGSACWRICCNLLRVVSAGECRRMERYNLAEYVYHGARISDGARAERTFSAAASGCKRGRFSLPA